MKNKIVFFSILCVLIASSGIGLLYFLNKNKEIIFSQPNFPVPSESTIRLGEKVVYGYLPYWTRKDATFPAPLTHISYFSLTIQSDGSILNIPKEKQDTGYRAYMNGFLPILRSQMLPIQKLDLTLTMMDQEAIPVFLKNKGAHQKLLQDITTVLETAPIDGINIDIEYNGEVDQELQNSFTSLVTDIRTLTRAKKPTFLLTVAIYGDAGQIERVTKGQDLAPNVDYLIVMAYDYHRRTSPRSGPISPLYGKAEGKWEADILNDLKKITDNVPASKVLLGIPFYGYEWSVEDATNPQSFTLPKTGETATYSRIQALLASGKAKELWDSTALAPYLLYTESGKQQLIYFENARSLAYKLRLVHQAGMGGIAIWALGYEGDSIDLWQTIQNLL